MTVQNGFDEGTSYINYRARIVLLSTYSALGCS